RKRVNSSGNRDWGRLAAGPWEAIWFSRRVRGEEDVAAFGAGSRVGGSAGARPQPACRPGRRPPVACFPPPRPHRPAPPRHPRPRAVAAENRGQNLLDTSEAHSYTAALIVPGLILVSPSVRGASIA